MAKDHIQVKGKSGKEEKLKTKNHKILKLNLWIEKVKFVQMCVIFSFLAFINKHNLKDYNVFARIF